jgi:hypothetical protein
MHRGGGLEAPSRAASWARVSSAHAWLAARQQVKRSDIAAGWIRAVEGAVGGGCMRGGDSVVKEGACLACTSAWLQVSSSAEKPSAGGSALPKKVQGRGYESHHMITYHQNIHGLTCRVQDSRSIGTGRPRGPQVLIDRRYNIPRMLWRTDPLTLATETHCVWPEKYILGRVG